MRRTVLSSLRAHLGRLVAACVAIVIGVGFATLALVVRSSAAHGVDQLIGERYAGVDAVVGPHDRPIQAGDLAAIRRLPQVDSVDAISSAYLRTTWRGDVRPSYMQVQAGLPDVRAASGRLPTAATEIALPARLAEKHQITVGSALTVHTGGDRPVGVTVVGTVDDSRSIGGAAAIATPAAVRTWEPSGGYDQIRIAAAAGVTPEQLVASVNKSVESGLRVLTGQAWIDREVRGYTGGIDVLGAVFGMFAAIALFVAGLVIANTFTILLAQRTREMALLRCVGASRRQVFTSVLAEAAVVGAVASSLGVAFGIGLSAIGLALAGRFDWGIPPVDLYADGMSLVLPFVLGAVATVLAAVVPARRATKVAPLAALRPDATVVAASKAGVVRLVLGFLLLAGGGMLLATGAIWHQVMVGVAGGMLSFLGVLAVGALLVPMLVRMAGAVPARGGGVPARIAVGNAVRNPRRTAATTSALLIGVTLISLTCVGIASVQKTFDRALDAEYPIDLTVSSGNQPMPPSAERQLREIDGISAVVPVRGATVRAGAADVSVIGVEPEAARAVVRGDVLAHLKPGTVLAPLGTLAEPDVTLTSGGRSVRVRVVLVDGIDQMLLAAPDLRKLAPDAAVTGFWLDAEGSDVIEAVEQSVPSVRELTVSGGLAERSVYTKVFDVLLVVAVALLGVSVLIALVGVGNTLSLSVLERTRENALLRALGLTRRQLRGMLAVESLLMALVAAGLGIGLGLVYGWAGTAALMGGQADEISYAIPAGLLATIALVAAAAGLLASVLPARRAARVTPATALATD